MNDILGIGVAGNFAGHLSQAGEDKDFNTTDDNAPKGIFPFYVPYDNADALGRYCINNQNIILPSDSNLCVQAEPEVGLECDLIYDENKKVIDIVPNFFMAFNDASVRNDKNATKLSQKKNFSTGSKAYGNKIPIDNFHEGGICDSYTLASFIRFDSELKAYGEASKLINYSYFHQKLLDWLKDRLNNQKDRSILEDFGKILQCSNYPKKALFAIGATCYSELGETRFLQENDEIFIVVFNHNKYDLAEIEKILSDSGRSFSPNNDISIIRQKVLRG